MSMKISVGNAGFRVSDTLYRFGYGTQEKDNSIAGAFKHNTAKFWEYSPLTLQRWNRDPKPITGISPYATFGNNPILNVDILGDIIRLTGTVEFQKQTLSHLQKLTSDKLVLGEGGVVGIQEAAMPVEKQREGTALLRNVLLNEFDNTVVESMTDNITDVDLNKSTLNEDGTRNVGAATTIHYNPNKLTGGKDVEGNVYRDPEIGLAHEVIHTDEANKGTVNLSKSDVTDPDSKAGSKLDKDELKVRRRENKIRKERGLPNRINK